VTQSVKLIVTLDCGHILTYTGAIQEKYPFWCDVCEETIREGKYPWTVTTEIVGNQFTDRQLAMIFGLIRADAQRLGWGSKFTEYNRSQWPRRLKSTRVIANLIHNMRGTYSGT
jgi:hypothetical protein